MNLRTNNEGKTDVYLVILNDAGNHDPADGSSHFPRRALQGFGEGLSAIHRVPRKRTTSREDIAENAPESSFDVSTTNNYGIGNKVRCCFFYLKDK